MSEQGKSRYDRSRYGSGSRTPSDADSKRSTGRYHDTFFEDMRISEEDVQSRATAHTVKTGSRNQNLETTVSDQSETSSPTSAPVRRSYSRSAVEAEIAAHNANKTSDQATDDVEAYSAKRKSRKTILIVVGVIVAAVVLVGAGVAAAYFSSISSNLRDGVDQELLDVLVDTNIAEEPFYMLLLGTDGSAEREASGDFDGVYRSDSMVLARIDVPNQTATLISISRDIPVDLGQYGEQKINAAYAFGGPALAVQAVSQLAGVSISHYAQIDFDGFSAMVDALGGVTVNVPMYIDDEDAGGTLAAGEQRLNGAQALILCRARHAYDDYGDGDMMRAANQRMVLSAIAKEALAADIGTIAHTMQTASEYVTTDLTLNEVIGLAQAMRGINPETDIYTGATPTLSQYVNGGWYEYIDRTAWTEMMKRVDQGLPPVEEAVVDPQTGVVLATAGDGATVANNKYCTITVKNATDISGLATQMRTDLMEAGYVNVVIGEVNEKYDYPKTLVVYDQEGRKSEAQQILDQVGQGELYFDKSGDYVMDYTDFLVIIGDNWT